MKLQKGLLIFVALAALPIAVAIFFSLIMPARDPVRLLVATIKKHGPYSEHYPIALQIEQTGLGNRAAQPVLELLDDEDSEIRKRAAEALAQIGADGSLIIPKLLEKRFDPDPSVRHAVLIALARARPTNDAVIDLFLEQTRNKDPRVKTGAAFTLSYMGAPAKRALPAVLPILIQALDDPRQKSGAAWALGGIGPEARDSIPMLRKMATTDADDYD